MTEIAQHNFEGSYSITFDCDTPVDGAIREAGHEPNGYFWEGVAQLLISSEAKHLAPKIEHDSEGSMFCAVSREAAPLDELAELMMPVINNRDRITAIMDTAEATGFEFDD